jgi:putative spermidine/putrescine transport system permease protein
VVGAGAREDPVIGKGAGPRSDPPGPPTARAVRARLGRRRAGLLLAPALALLVVFFLIPYANLLAMSFFTPATARPYDPVPTLGNYTSALTDSFQWWVLWRTLKLGLLTTIFTLLLGYPLAYHLARASSRVKGTLLILLLSPLLVGVVIRSFGWMVLLADNGLINSLGKYAGIAPHGFKLMYNELGVLVGTVHIYLPFMVLSLSGTLQQIPADLVSAARSLGASPARAFRRVVWPLSLPGVFAGCLLVFVLAVSSYVIPVLLGGFKVITTPLLVVQTAIDVNNWPGAAAQAMVLFAASLLCIGVYFKLMNRAMRGLAG